MEISVGFLSTRQHAELGYFGGLLILNALARPLEFQCTLPVKPTRAQELLYGPTLHDFVCGEQIAQALSVKCKLKPDWIFTDTPAVLGMTHVSKTNVVLVSSKEPPQASELILPVSRIQLRRLHVRDRELGVDLSVPVARDEPDVDSLLAAIDANFDLAEPFQRIVEALLEAHPAVRAA